MLFRIEGFLHGEETFKAINFDLKLMHQKQLNKDKEMENSSVKDDINFNMSSWRNAVEKPNNSMDIGGRE